MKKILLKTVTLLLALLMCAVSFASCKSDEGAETEETTNTVTTSFDDPFEYDENGYVKTRLPSDLDLDRQVRVLYWKDFNDSLYAGDDYELGADSVNDASYYRDLNTEDYLNIELEWYATEGGGYKYATNFIQEVATQINAGEEATQLIAGYSRCMMSLAIQGSLYDSKTLPTNYVDYEMPWWPDDLANQLQLGGSNFLFTGDISGDTITTMIAVFYNEDIIAANGLEHPIELVNTNQWTYEKMMEMAVKGYADDGLASTDGDTFGFSFVEWSTTSLYTGFGYSIVDNNDGYLSVSRDFSGEPAIDFVEKVMSLLQAEESAMTTFGGLKTSFSTSKTMFAKYEIRLVMSADVRDSTVNYGVVPLPKISADQDAYYTNPGLNYTIWGIISAVDEDTAVDMTAVLECMGSEAYRYLTPAIFEYGFKLKYSKTEDVSQMFTLVRDSLRYDVGFLLAPTVMSNKDIGYMMKNSALENTAWTTTYNTNKSSIMSNIRDINKKFG